MHIRFSVVIRSGPPHSLIGSSSSERRTLPTPFLCPITEMTASVVTWRDDVVWQRDTRRTRPPARGFAEACRRCCSLLCPPGAGWLSRRACVRAWWPRAPNRVSTNQSSYYGLPHFQINKWTVFLIYCCCPATRIDSIILNEFQKKKYNNSMTSQPRNDRIARKLLVDEKRQ